MRGFSISVPLTLQETSLGALRLSLGVSSSIGAFELASTTYFPFSVLVVFVEGDHKPRYQEFYKIQRSSRITLLLQINKESSSIFKMNTFYCGIDFQDIQFSSSNASGKALFPIQSVALGFSLVFFL